MRNTLAANLAVLIDHNFARYRSPTRRYQEIAKRLRTSLSQIQRLMAGAVGTGIDQLADLAELFHTDPWELLDPSFRARYSRSAAERISDQDPLHRHRN